MSNLERMIIVMMKMMMKRKVILILGVQNALECGRFHVDWSVLKAGGNDE